MADEWYTKPYKGGPMAVAAKYFPRPLYPPDATGKVPSKDGPDVLAYKRTICRLGRWGDWEPATWDQAFSNGFSHGNGPNVKETGVAGFQRQMDIDATGYIGQKTFNALASARVPDDPAFPHRGEMAMDANACNLIMEAYRYYGGEVEPPLPVPPAPKPPDKSVRQAALAGAVKWLGYKEDPPQSNCTTFGKWYGMDAQPWCAMAVTYWFEVDAGGSPSFAQGAAFSYCPYILQTAQKGQSGLSITNSPMPGDLVLYDWNYDGAPDHVGIFESGSAGSWNAIEANTSTSDNSNGGEVMRRARRSTDARVTFVRVAE